MTPTEQRTHEYTLNFSYGSNLWIDQMNRRCPNCKFIGVAILQDWRWLISRRGYANIVRSIGDHVYGFIYELNAADEQVLDRYEGVPASYEKLTLPVEVITGLDGYGFTKDGKRMVDTVVYVNETDIEDGIIVQEYIYRLHQAMKDAVKEGVPEEYFERYFRPFVPPLAN